MLIISGEKDHTVPPAISNASYHKQQRNESVTEIVEIPGRGHALTIDNGWREVANTASCFVTAVRETLSVRIGCEQSGVRAIRRRGAVRVAGAT